MRSQLLAIVCAFVLLCAAGCGPVKTTDTAEQPEESAPAKVIGASLLTKTHVFYQDLVAAMQEAAAEHNFTLRVQYCENDGTKQNNQIETYTLQEVDAIIVSPQDSATIAPAINEAAEKGIPVFTVDIAAHDANVVSHIASDNEQGGRRIGEYLAGLLDGEGNVAIIDKPEVASVQERVRGFEQALAAYPDITIVQKVQGEGVRDKALRATADLLQAHPDIDAIFGINDDSALGALAAVEAAGLQDDIIIVGYDGTPEALEAIVTETALKADTVQYPRAIGKQAIETIAAYFQGEEVPPVVHVECGIVDAAQLEGGEAAADAPEEQPADLPETEPEPGP